MSSYSSTFISKPKRDLSIIPQRLDHFINKEDKIQLTKITPIYATAIEMKPIFDTKLLKIAKKLKMLTNPGQDGWDWFDIKIKDDIEAKKNLKQNRHKKIPLCGYVSMPLKSKDRIIEKSIEDYDNTDPGPPIIHVKDIVRSSFICHSEEQISKLLKALDTTRGMQIISIKNRFQNPTPAGYRDLIVTVALIVPPIEAIDPSKINTSLSSIPSNEFVGEQQGGHLNKIVNKIENLSLNIYNLNNYSDEDGDVIKVNNTIGFICEIQIHHLEMLSFDKKNDVYPYYVYFRTYFGKAASNPKLLAEKIKVLKKMDQISNDVSLLDEFVDSFLSGNSRVSRDLERLKSFYSLFKKTNEFSLAEAVQIRIIYFQRERGLRSELSFSLSALAAQYTMFKRYNEAIILGEEALVICIEFYGDVHIETATQIKNLGILFACQSIADKAIGLFEKSLKIYNQLFVANHLNCRTCMKCILDVHEDQENWIQARLLRDKLTTLTIETVGIESPQVADLITGIAHIDEIEGNIIFKKFISFIYLSIYLFIYLPKSHSYHLSTSISGHYTNSIRRHLQAKDIYIGFYGQYHLTIASSLIAIADIYDQLGMWKLSLSYHKDALNIAINAVGEQHESVAHSYNLIGVILFSVGNLKEARYNLEKSLTIIDECIISLSPTSSHADNTNRSISLASIKNNLAEVLLHFGQDEINEKNCKNTDNNDNGNEKTGENNENEIVIGSGYKNLLKSSELLDSSLSIRSKVFGIDSLVTKQTLNNQSIAQELVRYEKLRLDTEEEYRQCEQRKVDKAITKEQAIIQKEQDVKELKANIDKMKMRGGYENLKAIKKYEEDQAKEAFELANRPEVIEIEEFVHQLQIKGPYDMTSGQQLNRSIYAANDLISEVDDLKEKCRYEEALERCLSALKLAVDVQKSSESHLPIAVILSYIGVLQEDCGNYSEAVFAFSQSVEILKDMFGDIPHSYLAISLYNLGLNLTTLQKYQDGLDNFQDSYRLWKQLRQDNNKSIEIGAIYHGISCCLVGLKRYEDAHKYIDLCIDIRRDLYGFSHPDTSASLNLKAIILAYKGGDELEDAFTINEEALEIREAICGRVHTAYASVLNNQGVLYYLVQDISRSGRILTMSMDIRERQVGMACNDSKIGLFNLTSIFEHPSTAPFEEEIPYLKKGMNLLLLLFYLL
jgi:tetratricopeptide (TPR) repeat protein